MSAVLQSRNVRKALSGTPTSPDLSGWSGLQDQIGAGEGHLSALALTVAAANHSAASRPESAFCRRAMTAGSFMKSLPRPGLRPRGV
ncbi:hypothetical protein ELI13_34480 [Rhizobium ruizarguesonis]|uniref:Uncharacterized protein n=1 Tax=Rhizobium ruizarguesonis TaxID=2081791 RepID=A0ABY1WXN2_9HYPH|nr:hypothetical protein ELI46_35430 [Rhizobium ruizarguesonis]TAU60557.1 hypothetical protein ELI46_36355 [Rhizobium ruizarguesonis]TAV20336.1 hypothetical protein ELI36_34410 [Rhizobium ruizarguesonis]TAV37623.1 hypothetical protein ELI33_10625 [Rhizobium ruizarguesonis]TAW49406.1 hypothetical protein ELI15_30080 [Rhizobium ruizarguesonis]